MKRSPETKDKRQENTRGTKASGPWPLRISAPATKAPPKRPTISGHDVEKSFGQANLFTQSGERQPRERREFMSLQHEGIPRNQRWPQFAGSKRQRIVPSRQSQNHGLGFGGDTFNMKAADELDRTSEDRRTDAAAAARASTDIRTSSSG